MSTRIGAKREIRKFEDMLRPGEMVKDMASGHDGRHGNGSGLLVLTD